jgi:RNA polymerase primary sigma factor
VGDNACQLKAPTFLYGKRTIYLIRLYLIPMSPVREDFLWQKQAFSLWNSIGRKGIIRAVPGSGKTLAGIRIIEGLLKESPDSKTLISCPTNQIIEQWKSAIKHLSESEIKVVTYFKAVKMLEKGYVPDLMILDECHSTLSAVRGKVLSSDVKYLLGLSATPEGTESLIGPIFLDIGWEEAQVAPFELTYVTFQMTLPEMTEYHRLTNWISSVIKMIEDEGTSDEDYMKIVMKRRSFVYTLSGRIPLALNLIKRYYGQKMMVFCERLEQVKRLAGYLKELNYPYSICTSEEDHIDDFRTNKTKILLTAKMVREGYDDPEVQVGIVVSTPLSTRNQVQTIGRLVRSLPGKTARVYWLIAKGTTDEDLIINGAVENAKVVNESFEPISYDIKFGEKYPFRAVGRVYHVDYEGNIFIRSGNSGRVYLKAEDENLSIAVKMILQMKGGGMFTITRNGSMVSQVGEKSIYLGKTSPGLVFIPKEKVEKREILFDDLFLTSEEMKQ